MFKLNDFTVTELKIIYDDVCHCYYNTTKNLANRFNILEKLNIPAFLLQDIYTVYCNDTPWIVIKE